MKASKSTSTIPQVLLFAFLITASIFARAIDAEVPHAQVTYKAIVQGTSAETLKRLQEFERFLKEILGVDSLDLKNIGCIECPTLKTDPNLKKLTFVLFREDSENLRFLVTTWNEIMKMKAADDFVMRFEAEAISTICSTKPQPCYTNNICVQTDRCDRSLTTSGCQACN